MVLSSWTYSNNSLQEALPSSTQLKWPTIKKFVIVPLPAISQGASLNHRLYNFIASSRGSWANMFVARGLKQLELFYHPDLNCLSCSSHHTPSHLRLLIRTSQLVICSSELRNLHPSSDISVGLAFSSSWSNHCVLHYRILKSFLTCARYIYLPWYTQRKRFSWIQDFTKTISYSNLSSQCVIVLNLSDNKLQFPGDPFEQNPLSLSFCTTQYVEDIASDLEPTNQIQHLKRGKKELVYIVKQSSSISHQNWASGHRYFHFWTNAEHHHHHHWPASIVIKHVNIHD